MRSLGRIKLDEMDKELSVRRKRQGALGLDGVQVLDNLGWDCADDVWNVGGASNKDSLGKVC